MEWIARVNDRWSVSDGALFRCHHCEGVALYWIGWWPYCSCGHDQRVCPFDFLQDFDRWFQWHLEREGLA